MIVACGFDHAGLPLRDRLLPLIEAVGHEVLDLGTDRRADRLPGQGARGGPRGRLGPSRARDHRLRLRRRGLGRRRARSRHPRGHDPRHYTAHQAVEHDGVNVLCLGGRVIGVEVAAEIVVAVPRRAALSGEERHVRRRAKVAEIERTGGARLDSPADAG